MLAVWIIGYLKENYRYKWKKSIKAVTSFLQIVLVLVFFAIFSGLFARHMSTEWERILISIFAFAPTLITLPALSRTEKYCDTLGQILGFKEFIVVTEEDKIKFVQAEVAMIPQNRITLPEDKVATFEKMIDALEDLDDVQNVYHNVDLPDEEE